MSVASLPVRGLLAAALASALLGAPAQAQTRAAPLSVMRTGDAAEPTALYDGVIVTYRAGAAERRSASAGAATVQRVLRAPATAAQWSSVHRRAAPALAATRRLSTGADLVRPARGLAEAELDTLLRTLSADPSVAHVEPNRYWQLVRPAATAAARVRAGSAAAAPDDPGYEMQWHFRAPDGTVEHLPNDPEGYANHGGIDVPGAWQYGRGAGVVVAVIDTGITAHPDLDTSLAAAGYDFISHAINSGRPADGRAAGGWDTGDWSDEDRFLLDNGGCVQPWQQRGSSWHGTHVSGTVAQVTGNALGMAGVAPEARVLPIRALGHCGGTTADIVDAIVWASGGSVPGVPDNQHPAEVINMSLGGFGTCPADSAYAQAIASARQRGTTVVVAAGNEGSDAGSFTPGNCPGAINVAATGITGQRAYYSNYGASIALSAPGGGTFANDGSSGDPVRAGYVWSAVNLGDRSPGDPGYGGMSGTSMAAPHVAGVAALAISAALQAGRPVPTPDQMREILLQTSRDFPAAPLRRIGVGILDAHKAAARAAGAAAGGDEPTAVRLARAVPAAGLAAAQDAGRLFRIDVPAGARNLQIRSFGGRGQVRLLARVGRSPAADGSNAALSSSRPGTAQSVQATLPSSDSYFVRLVGGAGGYSGVSLIATYSQP
ncbi:S8 family peptidase [Luteimonas sp. Y-2-2-4F]|nr:S8 family peptidase [Luteimonas sp. Y-2-2-4F]MCD9031895.1 S8 family peptidase [Luteimonas sp. Y-2-2-4F]